MYWLYPDQNGGEMSLRYVTVLLFLKTFSDMAAS